jgi:YggT family protein
MREISFLLDSVLSLIVGAFLLRLIFQLLRTEFRNPLVQAIVRITNPLVMPLRAVLPPLGRLDSASVVALLLAQLARTTLVLFVDFGRLPSVARLLALAVVALLDTTLLVFLVATFAHVILSWVAPDGYNPAGRLLGDLVEPLLRPFRRALPPLGGLDLSPLAVILLLYVLRMVLNDRILPLLLGAG